VITSIDFRFLLVELQLESVLSQREPRKLEAALRSGSLPSNLQNAYQAILQRISEDGASELVMKILSWIFHATEPILMEELREALAVESEDTQLHRRYFSEPAYLVEVCKGLITHDVASGVVRFTHSTVQVFLQVEVLESLLTVVDLAKILLTYLSFEIFKEPCKDDAELNDRMETHVLGRYAARWWPDYVRGQGEHDLQIQSLIFRLLRSHKYIESMLQLVDHRIECPVGITPLHFAAFHQFAYISRILVRHLDPTRFALNNQDLSTHDVLFSSDKFGHINDRDGNGETPLHVAAKKGHKEIAELLLLVGADVNTQSVPSVGLTPLHFAVIHGHDDVVDMLIKAGAEIDAKGRYCGETPLLLAALFGRVRVLDMLLKANADFSATTQGSRMTAIMWALSSLNAISVIELLVQAGADVNARDFKGRTALHYALYIHSFPTCKQVLRFLLKAGANPNIHCNISGNTPLHAAAYIDLQNRQYDLNLQKMKASFSTESVNELYAGRCAILTTPLPKHDEVEGAEELAEIVQLLLKWRADSTAKNFNGDTPLQCAIEAQNPVPAMMLLRAAGGKVEFTMNKLGDQEFLNSIEAVMLDAAD
jgi:ankyrin repeat protein